MIRLMNSRMMPVNGFYIIKPLSFNVFVSMLKSQPFISYIAYPENLALLNKATGLSLPVSRLKTEVRSGDILLCMSLTYRLEDSSKKAISSYAKSIDNFEFSIAHYFSTIEELHQFVDKSKQVSPVQKKTAKIRSQSNRESNVFVGTGLAERFTSHTVKQNDCLIWCAGKSVRLADGSEVTPRKVAWLLKYKELPTREIKLICLNEKCVYWGHMELGRESNAGKSRLEKETKKLIIKELKSGQQVKALAEKYNVSLGTVSNLKKQISE